MHAWAGSGFVACFAVLGLVALPNGTAAQSWPSKPITMIVPFSAGGAPDIIARFIAQDLTERLGQRVLVENRVGAAGDIGAAAVAKSRPDGHTLLLGTNAPVIVNKLLKEAAPGAFDPETMLEPVIVVGTSAQMLASSPATSWKTVGELAEAAKAKPGVLTAGVAGLGTTGHLTIEMLMQRTGTKFTVVPYRGTPPMADIVNGQLAVAATPSIAYLQLVNQGVLRALAVTSPNRSKLLPAVPTVAEGGLPGFESSTWYVLLAPTGTPSPVIGRLNTELNAYLKSPAGQKMLADFDVEGAGGPAQAAKDFIASEAAKWRAVIKTGNIKL
jgi:tripartite-type tricarboxylate transporter receptor subunit TctC